MSPDPTLTSFTSLTLLGKVRDLSDQQAWSEFVRRYTPKIFFWCKKYLLQDQDASDVTQQVLLKLVTAMQTFDYDPARGSFRGWLKTVTANAVRDLARKKSSSEVTGASAEPWLEKLADEGSIDFLTNQIEAGYQEELLSAAESRVQLRVQPQTWLIYKRLTDSTLSSQDVANEMNIKIADVYVAKSRVIKLLRETVTQMEQMT